MSIRTLQRQMKAIDVELRTLISKSTQIDNDIETLRIERRKVFREISDLQQQATLNELSNVGRDVG